MSNNNNKQPLDLTESLLVFDKAQAPSTTTPTVNKLDSDGISLGERRSGDVKPQEKNDSLGIPGINQPDVPTGNLSHTDETIAILLDCAKAGQTRGKQHQPSICKVPRILRDLSVESFAPQLVSIGPIHRKNEKLKEFEWLKGRYLDDLLNRRDFDPKKTLEACLQKVKTKIPQIRDFYACVIENCSDVELARMMVMDGCFILEFCFKHENEENLYLPNKMQITRIAMDLMLLENQVPFSVLQALFDCSMGKQSFTLSDVLDTYLAPYIQIFRSDLLPEKKSILSNVLDKYFAPYIQLFRSLLPETIPTTDVEAIVLPETIPTTDVEAIVLVTDVDSDSTHDHVLGYLHKRYQPVVAKSSNDEERMENTLYHSIVELDRSGINFKPHQDDNWSMTIKFQSPLFRCLPWFWSKPTLLMPTLVIDDFTELILRNFIAYEQSFHQDCDCFTSYAHAMDMLIDTQEDIAKLADSKVLVSQLGSNKEAADMINKIGRNISVTNFNYTKVFKQMDKYHNGFWPKNMAWLRKVYFNNPWNFLALLGALILFGLTVTQTIFTIRAA